MRVFAWVYEYLPEDMRWAMCECVYALEFCQGLLWVDVPARVYVVCARFSVLPQQIDQIESCWEVLLSVQSHHSGCL